MRNPLLNDPVRPVDPVHPSHYKGEIETFDYLRDKLGDEPYEGFLSGNVIKYLSRYKKKNGVEDLKKARVYLTRMIDLYEEGDEDEKVHAND